MHFFFPSSFPQTHKSFIRHLAVLCRIKGAVPEPSLKNPSYLEHSN